MVNKKSKKQTIKKTRKTNQAQSSSNSILLENYKTLKKIVYVLIAMVIIVFGLYLKPIITNSLKPANSNFGSRLTNIDAQFSAANLAIINNASNNYFEIAGQRLLNNSLTDPVLPFPANKSNQYPLFIANGKPSVIYIGAITCVFCGENRWAMALALSRFGSFSKLFYGYSAFGDHDVPTIYWNDYNYTTSSSVGYGNYYSSKYINFISADYESNITQGFTLRPLSFYVQLAPNQTYKNAFEFMNSTNKFVGTPFTFWGTSLVPGADAVVFGNSTPTSATLPLTSMTHQQVLNQIKNFNDQFAYGEYAAADVYIAYVCPGINNSASVCSLPAIKQLEIDMNLSK
ncbi:MAG: DUF929 domain-containing protein [Candidatus Marsarchaeota archaeon]|nr:DUF929 domain-containing protein [Candidatus Marsarchaeota archaeon]MCL5094854.1 DUF929 domain-containing protein [Candidatus Marsarchaeota archaeon]